ncbi:nickel transporter [Yinghuangia soli]|uniref:Nickel transporter n=1 Tax=Yinghuangia soli TaxID=2908204 RepID=A0AA41Q0G7_9ACTN|nr:nickel transporter [Yinghuangia soli]MCF2529218.1 nickel transporter [Yinghuangia soli]
MKSRTRQRIGAVLGAAALTAVAQAGVGAPAAEAHPLGNLSVNQYHGLTVRPDRVDDFAVLDLAEIPTRQERDRIDGDRDGTASAAELAAYAADSCGRVARDLRITVDGRASVWTVTGVRAEQQPGSGGLPTTRVECRLSAAAALDRPARLAVSSHHLADRVGWREFTAVGEGVALPLDAAPRASTSGELRNYPTDLLSSPLDRRSVELDVRPGTDAAPAGARVSTPEDSVLPGFVADAYDAVQETFDDLVGADDITVGAGLAAVLLALLLGASHAALPGHGKTVMAAYLALRNADGRRQGVRDAVMVGATVTLTHTAGVLALGLALTASASLTGESVLAYLGAASGILVAAVGVTLLRAALRGTGFVHGHTHEHGHAHSHEHGHGHSHEHGHGHGHGHGHEHAGRELVSAAATAFPGTGHGHPHPHAHAHPGTHGPGHEHEHDHAHTHTHHHGPADGPPPRRRVLVGMGIAGGLVPSPSALVVLLGAIALGRTAFGVLLVLAYGLGMAAVLTAAGLLLVRVRDRVRRGAVSGRAALLAKAARPVLRRTPVLTALFVVAVGLVLAWRGLSAPAAFG